MDAEVVLLDNDGILVSTEHLYFRATREIIGREGVSLREADYVRNNLVGSSGVWHLLEGVRAEDLTRLRAERDALYDHLLQTEAIEIGGVREALERLSSRYRLAVVTASDPGHFETIHARTNFLPFFECAVTTAHYRMSKPDPEPYRVAIDRMNAVAERCVAVEDSERGVTSATGAGLRCIAIPHGMSRETSFAQADRVAASLAEVCDLLGC